MKDKLKFGNIKMFKNINSMNLFIKQLVKHFKMADSVLEGSNYAFKYCKMWYF